MHLGQERGWCGGKAVQKVIWKKGENAEGRRFGLTEPKSKVLDLVFLRDGGDVRRRLPLSDLSDFSPWCAALYGGIGAIVTEVLLANASLPVLC